MFKPPSHLLSIPPRLWGSVKAIGLAIILHSLVFISFAQADTIEVSTCAAADLITAINTAQNNKEPDTLHLKAGCVYSLTQPDNMLFYYSETDTYSDDSNGLPVISTTITIEGHGATLQRTESITPFRFFKVVSPGQLTLSQVTLYNGKAEVTRNGGGVIGNSGGAIYNLGGQVVLSQTKIISSYANYNGGAIYNETGSVWVTDNSVISRNLAAGGGGIYNRSQLTMTQSKLKENRAILNGGAIYNSGRLEVNESLFEANSTQQDGGAIWNENRVRVTLSHFLQNSASDGGGGIYNLGAFQLIQSTVSNNFGRYGGGVTNYYIMNITATTINSNEGFFYGGGIHNPDSSSQLTLNNVTISDNYSSEEGSGLRNRGVITMNHNTVVNNYSSSNGGAIYNDLEGTLTLKNNIILQNFTNEEEIPYDVVGSFNSQGFNLMGTVLETTYLTVTDMVNITDPLLSPLQDNGGPTLTYLPLTSSLAIDEGECLPTVTTDQRGQPRPNSVSPLCDIGAVETDLRPQADLALNQTVSLTNPVPGQTIKFRLYLSNSGPNRAKGVVVADAIPNGYSFVEATPTQGTYNEKTGLWQVGTLAAQAEVTLTLEVKVNAMGVYTQAAQVQASLAQDPDSSPNNHSMTEDDESSLTITPRRPLLTISKQGPEKVRANETIVYNLIITNSGEVPATHLIVTDTIPMYATYLGGGNAVISNVLYWPSIPSLGVGQTAQVNFTVKATRDITNSDYGVSAEGNVQARGLISVATRVLVGSQGVFVKSQQQLGQANNQAVSMADLDHDGDNDAFVANLGSNEVWLNDGNGQFSQTGQTLGNGQSQAVDLADLDQDGDMDAVVGNNGNDEVWLNDGTGRFTNSGQALNSGNTQAVDLGDIDQDGDIDVVLGNSNNGEIWLNDGTGKFSSSQQSLNSGNTQAIALGDIDQDGDMDAVLGNEGADGVWLNDGTGKFSSSGQTLNLGNTEAIALGDIDQDGDIDAFLGNEGTNGVWLNDGTGKFTNHQQGLVYSQTQAIALGDLDEDGDLDAVLGNPTSQVILLNDGTGQFAHTGQNLNNGNTQAIALTDLDGDTDLDTFTSIGNAGGNQVWFNQNEHIATFDENGGELELGQGLTFTISIPANALDQSTVFTYTPLATLLHALPNSLKRLGQGFTLTADSNGREPTFSKPLSTKIYFHNTGVNASQVAFYYYDPSSKQWRDAATTCTPTAAYQRGPNFIQVNFCHLTEFALVEQLPIKKLYLPLMRK